MQKLFITICFSALLALATQGQRSLFLEAGGSGGLGSLNYDKIFTQKEVTNFGWRAGLAFIPIDPNNGVSIVFPFMAESVIGKTAHKLEVAAGQSLTVTTKGSFWVRAPLVVGYRYQPSDKKVFYRIAYTPIVSYFLDLQYEHWLGGSIGITLKPTTKKAKE